MYASFNSLSLYRYLFFISIFISIFPLFSYFLLLFCSHLCLSLILTDFLVLNFSTLSLFLFHSNFGRFMLFVLFYRRNELCLVYLSFSCM